jgi:hypothetical protein
VLAASVERWGPDAGAESELGRALELAGRLETAHAAYGRSLALQPENRDVRTALLHLADSIADLVHGSIEYRSAGDDSVFKAWAAGSWMLGNERTRLATTAEFANYRGRAAAVDDGATELTANVGKIRLAALHRFARNHTLGGGVEAYPGAPGGLPVGIWLDAAWRGSEPYYVIGVRAHGNLLWEDPAAVVSLGGRSSGLAAFASGDLGRRFWGGLDLGYRSLSLDRPTGGEARDGYLVANGTLGMRVTRGDQRVGVPVRLERSQVTGLVGPDVEGRPTDTRGPLINVWANYQLIRLLDDQELATLVPIGEAFDYLSLAGRADFHLARGFGVKVEGYAGYELQQANFVFGVETGLSWRPKRSLELDFVGAVGDALGRASSAPAFRLWLGMTYRW